jgi:hypothetical protein
MLRYYLLFAASLSAGVLNAQTPITDLVTFQQCLNGTLSAYTVSGYTTCPLAPGTYTIDGVTIPTLNISISNITVEGSSLSPSILQRSSASLVSLMTMDENLTNVTIQDLTLDGNRGYVLAQLGASTYCSQPNPSFYDLDLSNGSTSIVTAQYLTFINAPGAGLSLDGTYTTTSASTVSYSNWATGGPSTAGRATGIFLNGYQSGAYYNTIQYQGTAAVNSYTGSDQYIYGNTISWNRYEMPDQAGGGQIYTNASSSYASVAANIIDGEDWVTDGSTINGCATPTGQSPTGIEVAGVGHGFYDNQVQNHNGIGIEVDGSDLNDLTFSGTNPFNSSDTYRCTYHNGWRGMYFVSADNITLNDVCVTYTGQYGFTGVGIELDSSTGAGFINDACMNNNNTDITVSGGSLLNTSPSLTACH